MTDNSPVRIPNITVFCDDKLPTRQEATQHINMLIRQKHHLQTKIEMLTRATVSLPITVHSPLEIFMDQYFFSEQNEADMSVIEQHEFQSCLTQEIAKICRLIRTNREELNNNINQSTRPLATWYLIEETNDFAILFNTFASAFRDTVVAIIDAKRVRNETPPPKPYTQKTTEQLGIKPADNKVFHYNNSLTDAPETNLYELTGGTFFAIATNTRFEVARCGTLTAFGYKDKSDFDTLKALIHHQSTQLHWCRITVEADLSLHQTLSKVLTSPHLVHVIPVEPETTDHYTSLHFSVKTGSII